MNLSRAVLTVGARDDLDDGGMAHVAETVRAIRDAAARGLHEAKVSELSAQARERYADVLDRLGR